ncbi:uncharacterized protein LOC105663271 isoform X1 [Megachile rotundata]|uniref:uncharacterized protein LOC105663271 isoform X1 n=1 Tax=Megachile rotundata TaxID=143995 RepID=UPI003FD1254D
MCNISTRLDSLNQQLMVISKLQKMEEECNICPVATCKKCSLFNVGKVYQCAHRLLCLKEQCNKYNDKCILHSDSNRKILCNARTCKTRKKLIVCRDTKLAEGILIISCNKYYILIQSFLTVQTNLQNDIQVSRSINTINQDHLQMQETANKSNQINLNSQLYKTYVSDKVVNTHEEKSEQTIPTKDNFHMETSTNNSNVNIMQIAVLGKEKSKVEAERDVTEETDKLQEIYSTIETVQYRNLPSVNDKEIFERIQKDLLNEKTRNKELEKKLKALTCSLKCLEDKQRAACLKDSVETMDQETQLAVRESRARTNLIKGQQAIELIKGTREEELWNEIARLQQQTIEVAHANTVLSQERDSLRVQLQSFSEVEAKRCEEVEQELNRMKHAAEEKEDALNTEKTELRNMITELTNVIKIQKRRICEVTCVCNNQQHALQQKDKELHEKSSELSEVTQMLESSNESVNKLQEEVEELKYCLCEERKTCECLREEVQTLTENHSSDMRIKEKIIEEQNKTISKQKKLLHDSEEMAQLVACEFDQLKEQMHEEKQRNKSLQLTLDKTESKLSKVYQSQCEQCRKLVNEIDYLKKEKQRALTVARFAYEKLRQSFKQYQTKLAYERQQYRYLESIVNKKEQEIEYLKSQICPGTARPY